MSSDEEGTYVNIGRQGDPDEGNFVLEWGQEEIEAADCDVDKSICGKFSRLYTVAKVWSSLVVSGVVVKCHLKRAWSRKADFNVIDKGGLLFLIGFQLEEEKKLFLQGSPWLVSNKHLVVKD
ncbi:hypothetical protein Tsubulata_031550 [Turnera subulata]|uniref:DUF4283 domain-containing protein n=1 Tax=Turnera subulata TaxID=218843 RepID=A0A9Q0FL63_9ROSI|nr:hypothetical protein Tsubulata_031550 [Turnera subulata]